MSEIGEEDMEDEVEDDGLLTKAEQHHFKEESKRELGEKLKRMKTDDDDDLKLIVKESTRSKKAAKERKEKKLKALEDQERAASEATRSKEAYEVQK